MAGGFGSRYHGTTTTQAPGGFGSRAQAPAAKKPDHHGILGEIGHVVGQTGADLYHAAVNTPAGVYYLGKGLATDPVGTVKDVAKSTYQDIRHPLRHPGYTLLDVLGLLSAGAGTAARVASVGGKLAEGAKIGDVARAAVSKPHPGPRVHKIGGLKVQSDYARPVLARTVQKGTDKLLQREHAKNPTGKLGKTYEKRVNKALILNTRLETAAAQGPASALKAMGRKLKPHEQAALKVVANEAPIADRIAVVKQRIAVSSGAELKRHQERLANLEKAQALIGAAGEHAPAPRQFPVTRDEFSGASNPSIGAHDEFYRLMPNDGKHLYHSTSAAALEQIRKTGLRPGKERKGEITGVYFAEDGTGVTSLRPSGARASDALLRVKRSDVSTETTDMFEAGSGFSEHVSRQPVPSGHIEYLDTDGQWRPLKGDMRPALKPHLTKLQHVYDRMAAVAKNREELLKQIDSISEAGIQQHKTEVLRNALGQPLHDPQHTAPEIPGQLALQTEPASALATASPDAVYVPEKVTRRGSKALTQQPALGGQGTIGHAQAPRSLTAGYSGKASQHALERQDTTALVAEANLEAQKYAGAIHLRDMVKGAGHAVPQSHDDVFVRLDKLKAHDATPLEVRRFIDNPGEAYVPVENRQQHFADFLGKTFVRPRDMTPADRASFEKLAADGKGVWVSKTILGDWAKPQAPLSSVIGKRPVGTVDAINNASRFAILYLKPAYLAPNLLGNVTLNLIQQGPVGLARSLRKTSTLSFKHPELAARIDALMGEGIAKSVMGDSGVLNAAVQGGANVWSRVVDVAFRRSAWVYEAKKAGFTTPADIERLLTSDAHHDELLGVSRRANREIIDYGRLGNREKEIVRRVVFFYPWVKGSTMYAGHLATEHPITAAALGQVGKLGRERTQQDLGPLPSYLEGIFPVGKNRVVNPASAAILQTPAQVGAALSGLATGDVSKVAELSNFLTPAASLATSEIFRRSPTGYAYPGGTSGLGIAKDVLSSRLPQMTAYNRIQDARHGKGGNRLYPPNVLDALLQYGIGGLAPRKINPDVLTRLYAQEQSQMRSPR